MEIERQLSENTTSIEGIGIEKTSDNVSTRDHEVDDHELRDAARDLGARLKSARELGNMSIDAAGDLLKLLPETIVELESGEIVATSGKRLIYIEGYYRAYANVLGVKIDHTRFSVDHARPIDTEESSTRKVNYQSTEKLALTEHLRERSDAIIIGLVVVMVLVVGGITWLVWPSSDEPGSPSTGVVVTPSEPPPTEASVTEIPFYLRDESDPVNHDEPASVNETPSADGTSDESASSGEPPDEAVEGVSPQSLASDEETADAPTTGQSTDTLSDINAATRSEVPVQATGAVELTFTGPSWVEVYGADNSRLFYRMGQNGEVASLTGLIPFMLRIGDASVVSVIFNESEVDLAPHTVGNVANLTLQ